MEILLWFSVIQGLLGAFDMFYHHEFKEKLAWRKTASKELVLHGVRNFLYSMVFVSLGWVAWHGAYAWVFAGILVTEVLITLWDFVEEDRTRKLPESERITHTILTLNYGAMLMLFIPMIASWSEFPTGFYMMNHGLLSWIMSVYALGVFVWAWRELLRGISLGKKRPEMKNIFPELVKQNQNILVTGGTGFLGSRLCQHLIDEGHRVIILTRNVKKAAEMFTGRITFIGSLDRITNDEKIDVIINLAGEKMAQRWTANVKKIIHDSRIDMAKQLYSFIQRLNVKPEVFIQASAIGFYGIDNKTEFNENTPANNDNSFAQIICNELEKEVDNIESTAVRVCKMRIGLIVEKDGGALRELLIPFDCFAGGAMGNGKQCWSWIHRDDVMGIILHLINSRESKGVFNATAPNPVSNKIFTQSLGKAMHRPALLPMPDFIVKLLFGQMGNDLMLCGQKVVPTNILKSGYKFIYPEIDGAFAEIFKG